MAVSALIFLVHGTILRIGPLHLFARPNWIADGSPLRDSLCAALPNCHCEAFLWSGDNSHLEREAAGRNLAAQVSARAKQFPGVPILIVAHSHGGNVALYAMRSLPRQVSSRVAGLVTLGTPFIWFRERWSEAQKYALLRGLRNAAVGWAIACLLLFPLVASRFRWLELVPVVITVVLFYLFAWLRNVARVDWNVATRELITRFQPELPPRVRLLAVATDVDEAGWWLRGLMLPARLFDRLSFMGLDSFARNAAMPSELPRTKLNLYVQGGNLVASLLAGIVMHILWVVLEPLLRVLGWLFGCWFTGIIGGTQLVLGFIGRVCGRSAPWGFGESWALPWLVDVWTGVLPVGATATDLLRTRVITTLNLRSGEAEQTEIVKFTPKKLCSPHSWLHDDANVIVFVTKWARSRYATGSTAGSACEPSA